MRILTVCIYDDTFGDMLIRTCFTQLLRVVFDNLGAQPTDYEIDSMPLKEPDENKICNSNLIIFAGGGLFGLSYLAFYDYLKTILDIADDRNIPVIFSSLGMNNMDADAENETRLRALLDRKCIKSISVRENAELFRYYAEGSGKDVVPVCDPVVWAGSVYYKDTEESCYKESSRPAVGINFVRGGLFKSNGVKGWGLAAEERLLFDVYTSLEDSNCSCSFFTNGSFMDGLALLNFADKYQLPKEKIIVSDTSRELVKTIAGFDAVLAIRMHAAIISYAFGIPSVNLVWNPKIPFFYRNIGREQRAILPEDWNTEQMVEQVKLLLAEGRYEPDEDFLMSTYNFIYDSVCSELQQSRAEWKRPEKYGFEKVKTLLREMSVSEDEDVTDYKYKIQKAIKQYNKIRIENKELKAENSTLKAEKRTLAKENDKLHEENAKLTKEKEKLEKKLARIEDMPAVKAYRKLKGFTHKSDSAKEKSTDAR